METETKLEIAAPTDSTLITIAELGKLLGEIRGAKFVGFVSNTVPDMRKTGNPYYNTLRKESSIYNAIINWTYEISVNKQRIKEGKEPDFEALPRAWGERLRGTPLVEHKGKFYLEARMGNVRYTKFLNDGEEIEKEKVEEFLRKKSNEGARQELNSPIILRDYELKSIREIKMGGMVYRIKEE